jgi:hypothetical protein
LLDVGDDWLEELGYVLVAAIDHCVHFVFERLNKRQSLVKTFQNWQEALTSGNIGLI